MWWIQWIGAIFSNQKVSLGHFNHMQYPSHAANRISWVKWHCISRMFWLNFISFFFKSKHIWNVTDWIDPLFYAYWSFRILYLYCESGQRVTNRFSEFHNELCRCDWHLFPIEVQRMLVIVMSNTQQPTTIQGYGNIMCTRNSFKKVCIFQSDGCVLCLFVIASIIKCLLFSFFRPFMVDSPTLWRCDKFNSQTFSTPSFCCDR